MAPASQAFQLAWINRTMDALSGQVGSFRAATSLPHGAPAGRPRWRGNAKRLARGWTLEAIVARRRCPVVVLLTFFAALAGLVVRAYVARRQDHQYVLVNGISVDLSRRCADRTGLGCRAWARRSPVMHHGAIDVVAVCDAVAPPTVSLSWSAQPRRAGRARRSAVPKHPSHPNCWSGRVGRVYSPHSNVI